MIRVQTIPTPIEAILTRSPNDNGSDDSPTTGLEYASELEMSAADGL